MIECVHQLMPTEQEGTTLEQDLVLLILMSLWKTMAECTYQLLRTEQERVTLEQRLVILILKCLVHQI
ncbi:hypothetical protein T06_14381 [Trichinella sp. T6]|nr:hypothetical protein T06_14381 [Trichinella sp. T6]